MAHRDKETKLYKVGEAPMDDKNYTFRIAIESLWTSMRLTGKRGLRVGLDIRWGRASEITASDSGQEVAHSMGFRLSRGTGKPDG